MIKDLKKLLADKVKKTKAVITRQRPVVGDQWPVTKGIRQKQKA